MGSRKPFLNTLLGVVIAAGCVNESTSPAPSPSASLVSLNGVTLLNCSPTEPVSVSASIGKDGGTLQIGAHTLAIPEGAIKGKPVTITAETGGNLNNSIRFGPEGLQFNQAATLTVSAANCGNWGQIKKFLLAYVDENLNILELNGASVDNRANSISGLITHFSRYAVAY